VLFDVAFTLARRAAAGERITQAHRGHLYQVAQRAGMDARWVAALHWAFAAIGGIACLIFLHAPAVWRPFVTLLVVVPQLAWLGCVIALARRSGLGRW
jgi:UDP-GlcNAc:undecaprenyl-phosphate GlcNAc-1-phosphate transferase